MRRNMFKLVAVLVWFSVIAQFYLIIQNRAAPIPETIIRFFSYFTILTNTLVAVYFTTQAVQANKLTKPGTLTAITVYITIVGAVYQVLLRHIWDPTGLQRLVDELLHTINPVLVILCWYFYEEKRFVSYNQIPSWLIYPGVYLVYILVRGAYSGFYPYPFVNVLELGLSQVLVNSLVLLLVFILTAAIFIALGKRFSKPKLHTGTA